MFSIEASHLYTHTHIRSTQTHISPYLQPLTRSSRPLPVGSRFSSLTHPHRKQGCLRACPSRWDSLSRLPMPCCAVPCRAHGLPSIIPSIHPSRCFAPHTRFHAQTTQRPRRPYLTTHPPPCRMRNKVTTAQTGPMAHASPPHFLSSFSFQCANLRGFPNVGKVEQHDPVGYTKKKKRLRNLSSWCYYLRIHCDPPPFMVI